MLAILNLFLASILSFASSDVCTDIQRALPSKSAKDWTLMLNGRLIRPSTETEQQFLEKNQSGVFGHLVIQGSRIAKIFEGQKCNAADFGRLSNIVDLREKYVIPGLHDLHVHNFGMNSDIPNNPIFSKDNTEVEHIDFPGVEAMAYRMAYAGVTSYLDLGSDNKSALRLRTLQENGDAPKLSSRQTPIATSHVFLTGGIFALEGGHHADLSFLVGHEKAPTIFMPQAQTILQKDRAQRRKYFRSVLQPHIQHFRPNALKISYDHNPRRPGQPMILSFDRETLQDYVTAAKTISPNIKVICHIGIWQDILDCMDAGADASTHLPFSQANDVHYKAPKGIFAKMKTKGFTVIPTMTVYMEGGLIKQSLFNTTVEKSACLPTEEKCSCSHHVCTQTKETGFGNGNTHFFNDSLLQAVTPKALRKHYFDFQHYAGNPWIQWSVDHNKMGYRPPTFEKLMKAGVRVLSGTDTMWEGTFFGFSLHRELELMALANRTVQVPRKPISNMEILATSTSKVHDFLGHFRGRIQPRFFADLVVLNSSPIDSITNTRDIDAVMMDGKILDREYMKQELMGLQ